MGSIPPIGPSSSVYSNQPSDLDEKIKKYLKNINNDNPYISQDEWTEPFEYLIDLIPDCSEDQLRYIGKHLYEDRYTTYKDLYQNNPSVWTPEFEKNYEKLRPYLK